MNKVMIREAHLTPTHLHKNVIFGEKKGGDFRQLAYRRRMSVRYDRSQLIECIIEIVHSTAFTSIDIETYMLRTG